MAHTIIVHMQSDDPIVGEVEELPKATDTILTLMNPRRRDGKDIHFLQSDVLTVIWPLSQISFIEVLPSEVEESIVSFVRE
jgi:hypothetical protein